MAFFNRVSTSSFCAIVLVRTARTRSGGISHESERTSCCCSYVTRRFLLRSAVVTEFEGPAVAFFCVAGGFRFVFASGLWNRLVRASRSAAASSRCRVRSTASAATSGSASSSVEAKSEPKISASSAAAVKRAGVSDKQEGRRERCAGEFRSSRACQKATLAYHIGRAE